MIERAKNLKLSNFVDGFFGRRFSESELRDLKKLFMSLAYQSRSQGEYIIASVFQVLKFHLTLIRGVHIIICWTIGICFGFMISIRSFFARSFVFTWEDSPRCPIRT